MKKLCPGDVVIVSLTGKIGTIISIEGISKRINIYNLPVDIEITFSEGVEWHKSNKIKILFTKGEII